MLKLQEVAFILIIDDIYDINRSNIARGSQQFKSCVSKFIIFHYSSYKLIIQTTMYTLTFTMIISDVKRAKMDWG